MIQFNLLPDIKLQYIKAQRSKHMVVVSAVVVASAALALLILLFLGVNVLQKKHLSDLSRDIKQDSSTLTKKPDINKILTIQNQLKSLPELHNQNPVVSRLPGYITAVTPDQVSITTLNIDFVQKTLNIEGQADSLQTINKFVDTLKFTKYTVGADTNQVNSFSNVVLTTFAPSDQKSASYTINLSFDATIFDGSKTVNLVVPKIISTRSEVEKPSDLFQQPTNNTKAPGGQ